MGVDIGGTFTDLADYDVRTRRIRYTRSLTTHLRPLDGIMACVGKVRIDFDDAALFRRGTTLVINTLHEMDRALVALVTTRGFHVSREFGRGSRMGGIRPVLLQATGARAARLASRSVRLPIRKPRPSAVGRRAGLMAASWRGARRYRLNNLRLEIL
jgi:N-methylhydantoinase A/oxoprolinase/acetone carboxylase beta subunit